MFKLLIVDDEKVVAEGLAQYIDWERAGFEVAGIAYGADEALKFLQKEPVDILLTDIIMGEKNGIELMEEAMEKNHAMKGVILSGHEEFGFAKSAIKLGVYDYLVKPVDFEELETVFEKIAVRMKKERGLVPETDTLVGDKNGLQQENSEGIIINTVKEYISSHYGEALNLNMLAEMVYVHPTYLSILFKKKTGCNFKDYVAQIRIREAMRLLLDLSLRITDVSCQIGYDSPKHFSKVFKEVSGMTPKDFRNQKKGEVSL